MKLLKEDSKEYNYTLYKKIDSGTITIDDEEKRLISISSLQQKYNIDYDTAELLLGALSSINAVEFVPTYYAIPNKEFYNLCKTILDFIKKENKLNESKK